ncbi:MAG TPA: ATP-binding cassette domain-containing protein [Acidimicrobiales bacterium]|nr:ATP-binding cassette domain-containing protein [Acidimicrobiales bacterium]
MTRAYGSGRRCNIDESRHCNQRKARRRERPASLRTSDHGRPPDAPAHRAVQSGHMITTTALTKSYKKVPVVRDVSLRCEPGTITGFLGANGAGKSTTLKMIVGLVRPDRGTATIDGRPFVELPNPTRVVGTLLDASAMHPGRSGRATLTIAARLAGVPTGRVEHLLDLVGITDAAEKRVGTYSLGMRQRLGIAQALIGEPAALILDEPANGLDPDGIAWMRTLLRDFADHGGTVVLSSHLLHEVQATADHLVVISNGAVVAAGRLDDLLASSTILVRSPDPVALAAALQAARIDYIAGPDDALTVDISSGRVTTEVVAGVARDHQVLLTELRRSETNGLEQLFFSLTAAKAAAPQEAAA